MEITIPGAPISQARPRLTRTGHCYDPNSKEKALAKHFIKSQWHNKILIEPLTLDITFEMPIPTSLSKKKHNELIGKPHISRPDCDNLAKFSLDAMNGIIYYDDSCIFDLHVTKKYSEDPKTTIKISKCFLE